MYILPIYPFVAYFLAELMIHLYQNRGKALKIFTIIICILGGILSVVFGVVRMGCIPESLFGGKHAAENIAYLQALETMPLGFCNILLILIPLVVAGWFFFRLLKSGNYRSMAYASVASVFAILLALDGVIQPTVLNVKPDKHLAHDILDIVPEGPMYSFIKADMMR